MESIEGILTEPYTLEEIQEWHKERGYVEGEVGVALSDIIHTDWVGFLDLLSNELTGSSSLAEINYDIIGYTDDDTIYFRVRGDASAIIEESEREPTDEERVATAQEAMKRMEEPWLQNEFGSEATDIIFDALNEYIEKRPGKNK